MQRYKLQWSVGYTRDPSEPPERFVPSTTPGAAQLDWANAEGWPDYWRGENCMQFESMEAVYWVYESKVSKPELADNQKLFFVCEGVDYQFLIRLNGQTLHGQEGMFSPCCIDVTDAVSEGDTLQIVIFPHPDSGDYTSGRAEAKESVKPPCSYGWDWHPRLIPSGIWKDAYLETRNAFHIEDLQFDYMLEENLSQARVDLAIELNEIMSGSLEWSLADPNGDVADAQSVSLSSQKTVDIASDIFDPLLWWPNQQGEQHLYTLVISLHDPDGVVLDRKSKRVGFRRVQLVMNEGVWEEPHSLPTSRSVPPMTIEINGRRIFCKGSNWVPPEIFPGTIGEDTYRPLVEKAKQANFNMLRCWGGGIVNKESFFNLCDELGIMVWQEFPLACNDYAETPEYLDTLNNESRSIILQLKSHPSIVIWCGGNELFNSWSRMTDQHKALRLLNKNCYELDPDTPFLPTSPIMGVGHGDYLFRDAKGVECFEKFQKSRFSAYTEFGCPGPASAEYLESFIPDDELFPPKAGGSWETHHAFNAWDGHLSSWLCLEVIERYFGKAESLEELVSYGQILQSEGYKAMFEEARRQKPYCSMALNWCYNEPWPTAANNSIISWPCEPKPAYEAVKQSCRPILASARAEKFSWMEEEWFEAELWMLNDSPEIIKGDTLEAYLEFADEEVFALAWDFEAIEANANSRGPTLRYKLPAFDAQVLKLILRIEGQQDWQSEYTFCYKPLNPMMSE